MKNNLETQLSIYIHLPFCKSKCLYCDFTSYSGKEEYFEAYKNALINEIKNCNVKDRIVKTIFIGGGTPSIIPAIYIDEILQSVYKFFKVSNDAEITIEINPATINKEKLLIYKESGINRISIGLQAWQDRLLNILGRVHNNKDFVRNFESIRDSGFKNINVDLMFSLPNQTLSDWLETIQNIINIKPEHISCYSLIIEENTPFFDMFKSGKFTPISDDDDRMMYHKGIELLEHNGYYQYEISNFALKGLNSKHNTVYWKCKDYIGFGLAAHSFINGIRFHNTDNFSDYLKGKTVIEREVITQNEAYAEFMFLGLRMTEGIQKSDFYKRFGVNIKDVYSKQILELKDNNLLIEDNDFIKLSKKGIDVSNIVFVEFLL